MQKNDPLYQCYLNILERELLPAMGCTEPIAIAYAAAQARRTLGRTPEKVVVEASNNIIKNVKSVTVPNTDGLKGVEAAAVAGIIAGDPDKLLEVISVVTREQKQQIREMLLRDICSVKTTQSNLVFDLVVSLFAGAHSSTIRIVNDHTNIVFIRKDEKVLYEVPVDEAAGEKNEDEGQLTFERILDFANTCDLEDVRPMIKRQIDYNTAISEEGLKNDWGANIGKVILKNYDAKDVRVRAKAKAAAGSDARMSGCELPVVINSGSGNQGIAASIPVIEYAKEWDTPEEKLYRALVLSNLLGIHQKTGIGRLSAYCGAVSAGCASGVAICYLNGGTESEMKHTLVNCLAISSGIICDGAKPSCAAKIAESVDAAILGFSMAKEHQQFRAGEGIVKKGVENTIMSVGRLGKYGMRETDREILKIMLSD